MAKELLSEEVKERWKGVLEAEGVDPITDRNIRNTTTIVLENTMRETMNEAGNTTGTGFGATGTTHGTYDPVLISMIRRTMPSLIAHDLVGVQPMSMPTGLIFAMKAYYGGAGSAGGAVEAFGTTAPDATHTGDGTGAAATTAAGEVLGDAEQVGVTAAQAAGTAAFNAPVTKVAPWPEMSFEIQKTSVEAKTRKLKAKYTLELAQDLKAIHGMDAEAELSNILSTEVIGEINRELVNYIRSQSITGAVGTIVPGTFNMASTDTDGRWELEKYKNLYMFIVREASQIAIDTRRGVGNTLIVSPLVAAALEQVTTLKNTNADLPGSGMSAKDFLGVTYMGILGNRFKVFVDPYAVTDTVTIGYKGSSIYDSGIFYSPYVGLQFMKTTGSDDFQPRIGIASRYGLTHNPFVTGVAGANSYYRTFTVANI